MATKDLVNLGIAPDSGTGDSARRGGEKINTLFADIYTHFGDNPVGNDPDSAFYGYRRPFFEYEYKVGELHQTGRSNEVSFDSDSATPATFNTTWGWGCNSNGVLVDTDSDGIPDIYRDNHFYFLSRGEMLDAYINSSTSNAIHLVLPLAVPGDKIVVKDTFNTWPGKTVNIWTTPYEFRSEDQLTEWKVNTGYTSPPGNESMSITSAANNAVYRANFKRVETSTTYGNFAYGGSSTGVSPITFVNSSLIELEFVYIGHDYGWVMRSTYMNQETWSGSVSDLTTRALAFDSDLDVGLYILTDSDIAAPASIVKKQTGEEDSRTRGGLKLTTGDGNIVVTTGPKVTLTSVSDVNGVVRDYEALQAKFALSDDISVNGNIEVGGTALIGSHLTVQGDFTVNGTTTTVSAESLSISDNFVYLNGDDSEGTGTNIDLGWAGGYNDGTYRHAGLFRDATDGRFKVFDQYTPEPDAAVDINTAHASFHLATFQAGTFIGALTGNVTGNVSGNAGTATKLATARTIGGVSFDGSANINLPGVNTAGNQNTSGNAATASLATTASTLTFSGTVYDSVESFTLKQADGTIVKTYLGLVAQ